MDAHTGTVESGRDAAEVFPSGLDGGFICDGVVRRAFDLVAGDYRERVEGR